MKRYLLRGATALVLGGFIAACSHDDIDYSPIVDGKLKAYQEVFVDAYGQIDPNQNWGFTKIPGQQSAATARQTRANAVIQGDPFTFEETADYYATSVPDGATDGSTMTVSNDYQNITKVKLDNGTYSFHFWGGSRDIYINGNVTLNVDDSNSMNQARIFLLPGTTLNLNMSNYINNLEIYVAATAVLYYNAEKLYNQTGGGKIYNQGTVNLQKNNFEINQNAIFYNEGDINGVSITSKPGDGNKSFLYNWGHIDLSGDMIMNSCTNFYNEGTIDVDGETAVTQKDIWWINKGHYTTTTMEFSAKNSTFYNYCQLIVKEECKFMDGEFNLMNNSYAQIGKAKMDNFIVNMGDNAGISILNGCNYGRQGDGTYQGFYAFDDYAKAYVRIGGTSHVPVQQDGSLRVRGANLTFAYDTMIFYEGWSSLEDDGYSDVTTQAQLDAKQDPRIEWNRNNVTKIITGEDFARTRFIVKDGECAATWISSDTQIIPIDQGETTEDFERVETIKEYYETTTLIEQGRVFCEDLVQISTNDLDFNDVVFDAYVYTVVPSIRTVVRVDGVQESDSEEEGETTYKTTIVLLAAGGTLPLSIAGSYEVHNVLGGVPVSTIVNTIIDNDGAYHNPWSTHDPVILGTEFGYQTIEDIPIVVQYVNGETLKLEAITGWAPHKILVPIGTKWCKERVDIATAYTKFKEYVGGEEGFWTDGIESSLLYSHPMDTYRPRSKDPVKKLISVDEPVITKRYKGETITTGGYQEGEEVLSRKNVWFNE